MKLRALLLGALGLGVAAAASCDLSDIRAGASTTGSSVLTSGAAGSGGDPSTGAGGSTTSESSGGAGAGGSGGTGGSTCTGGLASPVAIHNSATQQSFIADPPLAGSSNSVFAPPVAAIRAAQGSGAPLFGISANGPVTDGTTTFGGGAGGGGGGPPMAFMLKGEPGKWTQIGPTITGNNIGLRGLAANGNQRAMLVQNVGGPASVDGKDIRQIWNGGGMVIVTGEQSTKIFRTRSVNDLDKAGAPFPNTPRAVALDGTRVYVTGHFQDSMKILIEDAGASGVTLSNGTPGLGCALTDGVGPQSRFPFLFGCNHSAGAASCGCANFPLVLGANVDDTIKQATNRHVQPLGLAVLGTYALMVGRFGGMIHAPRPGGDLWFPAGQMPLPNTEDYPFAMALDVSSSPYVPKWIAPTDLDPKTAGHGELRSVAFTADGKHAVACGSTEGPTPCGDASGWLAMLFDLEDGSHTCIPLASLAQDPLDSGKCLSVDVSGDLAYFAGYVGVAGYQGRVAVVDLGSPAPFKTTVRTFQDMPQDLSVVNSAAPFGPCNTLIAGSFSGSLGPLSTSGKDWDFFAGTSE